MNITSLASFLGILLESNLSPSKVWFTISIPALDSIQWLGVLELPLLLTTLLCSLLLSIQFKAVKLSTHLIVLFWGVIIMGLGQFRMETAHLFHDTTLQTFFGHTISESLWYIALLITWGMPILGFYKLYTVHKT